MGVIYLIVISFERTKSLSYFYRVFTYHSALSPAGVRHSESCLVGEDQRSVYDSYYLAIRLTNLPVFSFQSVPFSREPLKWNGETFFAVFNFLYMACSSTLPNMRRTYRSFKKEGRRVFLLSFFFFFRLSLFKYLSYVSLQTTAVLLDFSSQSMAFTTVRFLSFVSCVSSQTITLFIAIRTVPGLPAWTDN